MVGDLEVIPRGTERISTGKSASVYRWCEVAVASSSWVTGTRKESGTGPEREVDDLDCP